MKPATRPLTHERLIQVLSYDPKTGIFRWLVSLSRRTTIGDRAGCVPADGYRVIQIDRYAYKASRLAWFYYYGRWPLEQVDHADLARDNNRIKNLREATRFQNGANIGLLPTNTTGFKGVSRATPTGARWKAQIRDQNKRIHLGYFASPEEAYRAYCSAAQRIHGLFARLV